MLRFFNREGHEDASLFYWNADGTDLLCKTLIFADFDCFTFFNREGHKGGRKEHKEASLFLDETIFFHRKHGKRSIQ